jgi:Zn-dependent peptidase ImmA (M78 family)
MMLGLLKVDPTPLAIIERYTQDAPVRVEAIARDLGIAVIQEIMEPDVAGRIVRDDTTRSPAGFSIFINSRDPVRRQRFTLAHELGHFVLHRDIIGDGLIDDAMYRSRLADMYERQANRWAADTLMPAALVKGLYRGGMRSLAELSNTLDVSEEAIRIRLSELSLGP